MKFVYLIGPPGAGKSTILEHMRKAWGYPYEQTQPVAHTVYPDTDTIELGRIRPPFSGTDTLAMNAQPRIVEWLTWLKTNNPPRLIIGEGDRLANERFLTDLMPRITQHTIIISLHVPEDELHLRRTKRAKTHNLNPQNPTWVKGRITKWKNLDRHAHHRLTNTDPATTAHAILELTHAIPTPR